MCLTKCTSLLNTPLRQVGINAAPRNHHRKVVYVRLRAFPLSSTFTKRNDASAKVIERPPSHNLPLNIFWYFAIVSLDLVL